MAEIDYIDKKTGSVTTPYRIKDNQAYYKPADGIPASDLKADIREKISNTYTKSETDTLLVAKANTADVYGKSAVDTALAGKANVGDAYTKAEADAMLIEKADVGDSYTKAEADTLLGNKANSADVYDKSAVDTALNGKADKSTTYTKTEVDTALSSKADSTAIPTTIAQLTDDATHRVVTDTEKSTWNGKSDFSGDYNDLANKPTIPSVPSNVSAFTNDSGYLVASDISNKADKSAQITSGTEITLADNTEYRLTDVTTLAVTYPTGNFECWMRIAVASEGTVNISFPSSTHIGDAPTFANGEVWELSIKDACMIASKVTV